MRSAPRTELKPLVELVTANYALVARDLLNPMLELLRLSRLCTGDAESFLILLVIAVRVAEDPQFRAASVEDLVPLAELPSRGTNIRSIAASLDMPKETVRRKVAELAEAGWVVRREGELTLSGRVFTDLANLKRSLEELAARNYLTVHELLAREGEATGTGPAEERTLPAS